MWRTSESFGTRRYIQSDDTTSKAYLSETLVYLILHRVDSGRKIFNGDFGKPWGTWKSVTDLCWLTGNHLVYNS